MQKRKVSVSGGVTRANAVEVKRPVVTIEKSKFRNTASESTVA